MREDCRARLCLLCSSPSSPAAAPPLAPSGGRPLAPPPPAGGGRGGMNRRGRRKQASPRFIRGEFETPSVCCASPPLGRNQPTRPRVSPNKMDDSHTSMPTLARLQHRSRSFTVTRPRRGRHNDLVLNTNTTATTLLGRTTDSEPILIVHIQPYRTRLANRVGLVVEAMAS